MPKDAQQMTSTNKEVTIWLPTLLLGAVVPLVIAALIHIFLNNPPWINLPLHSLLESVGAFAAIALAMFIITMRRSDEISPIYIWVATSLVGMGIFDAFHAAVSPGETFIWLHSLSTFVGGIIFAFIIFPPSQHKAINSLPIAMAMVAAIIGILSLLFPAFIPSMTTDGAFSAFAIFLNITGGIGFVIAWLFFAFKTSSGEPLERKLLASHTLLFGSAALLFPFSMLWDNTWWLWHFLRLTAYLVILSFFFKIYLNNIARIRENEQRLRDSAKKLNHERALISGVIENTASLISLKDTDGRYLLTNTNFADFFNLSSTDIVGKRVNQILSKNDAQYEQQQDQKIIDNKRRFEEELTYQFDNEEYTFITSRFPLINHLGEVYAIGLVLTDISIRTHMEKSLELAKKIIEHTNEGIIVTNQYHRIEEVNSAFSEITGFSSQEVMQKLPLYCDTETSNGPDFATIKHQLENDGYWSGEVWGNKKNGQSTPLWISITAIYDANKEVSNYVSIFHDISKSKQIEAQLEELAYYDPLTSLPNRTFFKERLQHDIAASQRHSEQLSLLLFDLDEFKMINDSMGHDAGDEILKQSAQRIKACIRESDTVARLGGDEFIVITLNLHGSVAANQIANKIIKALNAPFYINELPVNVGASIGISVYPNDGENVSELVKSADLALYKAKAAGGNRYQYFSKELQLIANENMQLRSEIRDAIKDSQFEVFYQAKVAANSQEVNGMEALVRWNHPEKGLISPFKFIPNAEQSGSIIEIGEIVLIQACLDAIHWQEKFKKDLVMSVNLSTKQFKDEYLMDKIKYALNLSGLSPHCLELEITESSVMDDVDEALKTLYAIHDLGIRIAIDDFGTGYSSLAYLKRFPINTIKIDQSFVQDIETDSDDRAIIESIILLSEKLNVEVVAEGVENRAQLTFLQNNHCHSIQGYLFHKPTNKTEFEYYLQQQFDKKENI